MKLKIPTQAEFERGKKQEATMIRGQIKNLKQQRAKEIARVKRKYDQDIAHKERSLRGTLSRSYNSFVASSKKAFEGIKHRL